MGRTIIEVQGSVGLLRVMEDAVEVVYAMIESMDLVHEKQNINDSSTLQLSTQVHEVTQNIYYPYEL